MGLITKTNQSYYNKSQGFVGTGSATGFTLTTAAFESIPTSVVVFVDGKEINTNNYSYSSPTVTFSGNVSNADVLANNGAPLAGKIIEIKPTGSLNKFGDYRYISLNDAINNYMVAFVGDGKLIPSVKKSDVLFHAKRGIQEFSYDIARTEKIQEIEVGTSLSIPMPQDYIHYVRISFIDDTGIEHIVYPARYTSKPSESILQDDDYNYLFDVDGSLLTGTPVTDDRFKTFDNRKISGNFAEEDISYDTSIGLQKITSYGGRKGSNPETTQENGVFIIDELNGKISFSSELAGQIVTLKYTSDGLGTDDEMKIHKFAEDAIYKYITYGVASSRANFPEYIINRFRKEKRAAIRNAKLRLSSLKIAELEQVMRGKSKFIKH
jgi:hypothetical protein